jgi:hypothetical protein
VLPRRLAYPEVLAAADGADDFFYAAAGDDGEQTAALAARLAELAARLESGGGRAALWRGDPSRGHRAVARYLWDVRAPALDAALAALLR